MSRLIDHTAAFKDSRVPSRDGTPGDFQSNALPRVIGAVSGVIAIAEAIGVAVMALRHLSQTSDSSECEPAPMDHPALAIRNSLASCITAVNPDLSQMTQTDTLFEISWDTGL
jgi:hypothetical protein